MIDRTYIYPIVGVDRVVDGDTYWVYLDVGFRQTQLTNIRLYGYDTPESNRGTTFEKSQSKVAKSIAEVFLSNSCWVSTYPDPDVYGRWLGEVYRFVEGSPIYLGDSLRSAELASLWPVRWREEFDIIKP